MAHPALMSSPSATHHSCVSRVESEQLADAIRHDLLSVSSSDRYVQQIHKDLQQRRSKLVEKFALILTDGHNRKQPVVRQLVSTLTGFFGARSRAARAYCDSSSLETREEGEMNQAQNRVDLGDHSRPALLALKKEICESREALDQLEASVDAELFGSGAERSTTS